MRFVMSHTFRMETLLVIYRAACNPSSDKPDRMSSVFWSRTSWVSAVKLVELVTARVSALYQLGNRGAQEQLDTDPKASSSMHKSLVLTMR